MAAWKAMLIISFFPLVSLLVGSGIRAQEIDSEADNILKAMSAYLGGTKAFSVNANIDFEIVTQSGQKLQLSSFATVVMQRPAKFHIQRRGVVADAELIFDGKTLTLYGKNLNVYSQTDVSGTIDDAIRAYEFETGLSAPGADLLFADLYAILTSGVKSSTYIGTAYVNGVECHHLAFREDEVDWQLWVQAGDAPLPIKYVITSKWHTGAPQYAIRLQDWNRNPEVKENLFTFTAPEGARKLDTIPVNEIGELTLKEKQ
jgi:hypothetical protein